MKRSKARVPFTSWCCNIVIRSGSRVIIMGVTYMFNIFIKISRAMSLIYFMWRRLMVVILELLGIWAPLNGIE